MEPDASAVSPEPVAVALPLRGEWAAVNTPGHKVPSHGTHALAQTYAYDFIRLDKNAAGYKFFDGTSGLRHFFLGVKLERCFGWGEPIYAPFSGEVVAARDGWPERNPSHPLGDLALALWNGFTFESKAKRELRAIAGNHLIVKAQGAETYAFLAHCQTGSICVAQGDKVDTGAVLARVGHSGNSTAPHLHFHLMDGPDLITARGLPCCFEAYETLNGSEWVSTTNGIPGRREFIRS